MKFRCWTISLLGLLAGLAIWTWLFHDLPLPEVTLERLVVPSVRIEDRHGRILYEVLDSNSGRHAVVPLESIPLVCHQATIATEDRNYYRHSGIDLTGILRAVWIDLRKGRLSAGGSTIPQQVARNLLLEEDERFERSLRRKLREAMLAWQLSHRLSKDAILGLYLNHTYYGGLAYGIEAAAQTYFGSSVAELDLAQCAILAGLPQAPALYNPYTDPEAARNRQAVVLGLMESAGYIDKEDRELALREPLVYAETPYPMEAPHFSMMARAELDQLFRPGEILRYGGLTVRTSLDLDWQRLAEIAVQRHLQELQHSEDGLGHNVNNAAVVALDPHTGDILALVGSPDYFDTQHGGAINMALVPRQPGSALKPLVYAASLRPDFLGGGWTAATMLLDVRTAFLTHEGEAYVPANYDLQEHGPVLVREALGSSLNIPAVLALEHVGLEQFFQFAGKLGISTFGDPKQYDLSLALGGGEVRLMELTAAYGALANSGFRVDPRIILEVRSADGKVVYSAADPQEVRVLDERIAWLISDILSDNDARRLGFGPNSLLRIGRPAAVKTGTTSNFHDNWTLGYTPDLVVGVWSGNTSYQSMRGVNGLSGAAPIWHQFIRSALAGRQELNFSRPPGLIQTEICALSGKLPGSTCPYRRNEWFIQGTQPTETDTLYREIFLDASTGQPARQDTPIERRIRKLALDLPPQAHSWARKQGIFLTADLEFLTDPESLPPSPEPVRTAVNTGTNAQPNIRLVSPASGSRYRLAPHLSREMQRIPLEAAGTAEVREVLLWIDGMIVARLDSTPYRAWWSLTAGEHRAWAQAVLADGSLITGDVVTFSVSLP